jgi:signal transduction histidine kinase
MSAHSTYSPHEGTPGRRRGVRYPGPLGLLLVWTLIGALSYGRHYLLEHSAAPPENLLFEFLIWQTCFLPWVGLSPLVFRLEQRYPLGSSSSVANLVRLSLAGLPFAYAGAQVALILSLGVELFFGRRPDIPAQWWLPPISELWVILLIYASVIVAGYMLRSLDRLQRREQEAAELALQKSQLEASLRQAELETLRARLNPHFLFNCLQNISVLTQEDPQTARQMLVRVGDLLRTALRGDGPETTLQSEIALTRSYLAIEQIRFGERLSVLFDIPPETEPALVPTFLLQPLVENAVVHGLRDVYRGGIISVRGGVDSGALVLTITDNGSGLSRDSLPDRTGVGLSSTCERLARMYPGQHSFSMRSLPEGGTEVRISLPLRLAPAAADVHEQTALVDR